MGSQDFVREVYDASYRRLVAQLFALCGDLHDAEEIVQEAFVKALRRASSFASVDNPEAWLRTVAVNLLRSRWRRSRLWRGLLPGLPGSAHTAELSADHVALVDALGGSRFRCAKSSCCTTSPTCRRARSRRRSEWRRAR